MGIRAYIKDFQKSDAPQFKGKSKEERRDQAVAAYLQAKDDMKEDKGRGPTGIAYSLPKGHPDAENPATGKKYPERQTPKYKKDYAKNSPIKLSGKFPTIRSGFGEAMDSEINVDGYQTKHFHMCGSAIKAMKKHADKEGAKSLTKMQDMFYKMEKDVMNAGEATDAQKKQANMLYTKIIAKARSMGIEDEIDDYMKMHRDSVMKGDPKPGFGRVDMKESKRVTQVSLDQAKRDLKMKKIQKKMNSLDEISVGLRNRYYDAAKKSHDTAANSAFAASLRKEPYDKYIDTTLRRKKGIKTAKDQAIKNIRGELYKKKTEAMDPMMLGRMQAQAAATQRSNQKKRDEEEADEMKKKMMTPSDKNKLLKVRQMLDKEKKAANESINFIGAPGLTGPSSGPYGTKRPKRSQLREPDDSASAHMLQRIHGEKKARKILYARRIRKKAGLTFHGSTAAALKHHKKTGQAFKDAIVPPKRGVLTKMKDKLLGKAHPLFRDMDEGAFYGRDDMVKAFKDADKKKGMVRVMKSDGGMRHTVTVKRNSPNHKDLEKKGYKMDPYFNEMTMGQGIMVKKVPAGDPAPQGFKLKKLAKMHGGKFDIYHKETEKVRDAKAGRTMYSDTTTEKLDHQDKPLVKKVVGMLKKASKAHAGQAKSLSKAMTDEGYIKSDKVYPHPQANLTKMQRRALTALDKRAKKPVTLPGMDMLKKKEKEPAKVGRQSQIVRYEARGVPRTYAKTFSKMNLKKARELMSPAKHREDGINRIAKGMGISKAKATKHHDEVMKSYGFRPESVNEVSMKTLGNYIKKRQHDVAAAGSQMTGDYGIGPAEKKAKRRAGVDAYVKATRNISKAVDKMTGKAKVPATESTWYMPTGKELIVLRNMMKKPIELGENAKNAIDNIPIGSDILHRIFVAEAKKDPNTDARAMIESWLSDRLKHGDEEAEWLGIRLGLLEGYEADVSKFMNKHDIDHHWSGGKLHVDKKDEKRAMKKLEKKYGGYGPRGAKMMPQVHVKK